MSIHSSFRQLCYAPHPRLPVTDIESIGCQSSSGLDRRPPSCSIFESELDCGDRRLVRDMMCVVWLERGWSVLELRLYQQSYPYQMLDVDTRRCKGLCQATIATEFTYRSGQGDARCSGWQAWEPAWNHSTEPGFLPHWRICSSTSAQTASIKLAFALTHCG